jgi:hypothetical protein
MTKGEVSCTKNFKIAKEIATPSFDSVPLPISSIKTKDFPSEF